MVPSSSSFFIQYSTSSTRPIANEGMISLPPLRDRVLDDGCEAGSLVVRLVDTIAIGGLEQKHIGLRRRRRIRQHGARIASQVAAEENGRATFDSHPDERRAEQVAGVNELDVDAFDERHGLLNSTD